MTYYTKNTPIYCEVDKEMLTERILKIIVN